MNVGFLGKEGRSELYQACVKKAKETAGGAGGGGTVVLLVSWRPLPALGGGGAGRIVPTEKKKRVNFLKFYLNSVSYNF